MDQLVSAVLWLLISICFILAIVYGAFYLHPILGYIVLGIVGLIVTWGVAFGYAASTGYRPTGPESTIPVIKQYTREGF
jgi:hypothetical protein